MTTEAKPAPRPPEIVMRAGRSLRDFLKQESAGGIVLIAPDKEVAEGERMH